MKRLVAASCLAWTLVVVETARAQLEPVETMVVPALEGGEPLALSEVLRSVERHHPQLDAAEARVASARGTQLAAEGGFDPELSASAHVAPLGYYEYARAQAQITQATPLWGASVFAGWRIGRGLGDPGIPIYDGAYETLDGGELRAGVRVPLWRDGPIDARRAAIARAERGVDAAREDLDARMLRVRLAASEAYWRWVAAGLKARIAREQLDLAETRDAQIAARVAAGAIPAIEHLENRRAILERQQAMVVALRQLERAAIQLSLYLRDDLGAPLVPSPRRVPAPPDRPPPIDTSEAALLERAIDARPELARMRALIDAARVSVELAENQVAPRVDVVIAASSDLGGDGDPARQARLEPIALEASVAVSVPLGLREARGRADSARADARALEAEAEIALDQVRLEVRDALSAYRASERALALAVESAEVAERVAQGERSRFEHGASTLLVVNLREAAAAAARAGVADARADLWIAHLWIGVATGGELR